MSAFQPAAAPDVSAFAPAPAPAPSASSSLGAVAYSQGASASFGSAPDLATVAHEASHVVQQPSGRVGGSAQGAAPFQGMY